MLLVGRSPDEQQVGAMPGSTLIPPVPIAHRTRETRFRNQGCRKRVSARGCYGNHAQAIDQHDD